MRNLIVILGDQLNLDSAAYDGFDRSVDAVWMAEVEEEATYVWSHKLRIALFFSAMRHFRDELRSRQFTVHYSELEQESENDRGQNFADMLRKDVTQLKPRKLILVRPGDFRVWSNFKGFAKESKIELEVRPDRHFLCSVEDFQLYAETSKNLLLENFYRHMRKKHDVLMTNEAKPVQGKWNFDKENRQRFGSDKRRKIPAPYAFPADETTKRVIELIQARFGDHPGSLEHFSLPVTREQAKTMLSEFIENALPDFGSFQDAMWMGEPFLFHSRLSAPLNLKLLHPKECIDAALKAHESGHVPINSVEGFIRQILGWREYIHGVYWTYMPDYIDMNYLDHDLDLPSFYWDGDTSMKCLQETMQHVLNHGYSHHIHRLMVAGLFALLSGCHPRKFHDWHVAMYLDAIDWVSLPNTLGMSQYGDGGIVGTKPYCASGNYINKMSNFCSHCRFNYKAAFGDGACPFTTLYWDFLDRHYDKLKDNARMQLQLHNVERKREDKAGFRKLKKRADEIRRGSADLSELE